MAILTNFFQLKRVIKGMFLVWDPERVMMRVKELVKLCAAYHEVHSVRKRSDHLMFMGLRICKTTIESFLLAVKFKKENLKSMPRNKQGPFVI